MDGGETASTMPAPLINAGPVDRDVTKRRAQQVVAQADR